MALAPERVEVGHAVAPVLLLLASTDVLVVAGQQGHRAVRIRDRCYRPCHYIRPWIVACPGTGAVLPAAMVRLSRREASAARPSPSSVPPCGLQDTRWRVLRVWLHPFQWEHSADTLVQETGKQVHSSPSMRTRATSAPISLRLARCGIASASAGTWRVSTMRPGRLSVPLLSVTKHDE